MRRTCSKLSSSSPSLFFHGARRGLWIFAFFLWSPKRPSSFSVRLSMIVRRFSHTTYRTKLTCFDLKDRAATGNNLSKELRATEHRAQVLLLIATLRPSPISTPLWLPLAALTSGKTMSCIIRVLNIACTRQKANLVLPNRQVPFYS